MKTNIPTFSKKTLTRLQNPAFRKSILLKCLPKFKDIGLEEYAMHLLTLQEKTRTKTYETDKNMFYGYQPVNVLGAVLNDGTVKVQLFEFKLINTFLKNKNIQDALEILKCILCLWKISTPNIKYFDIQQIEDHISTIENTMLKKD